MHNIHVTITTGDKSRRDLFQFIDHRCGVQITAVENAIHAIESVMDLLPQLIDGPRHMRIGDQTNAQSALFKQFILDKTVLKT